MALAPCATTLAQLEPRTTAPAAQLAEYYDLPAAYLAKQLQTLVKAGVLAATKDRAAGSDSPDRQPRSRCCTSSKRSTAPPHCMSSARSGSGSPAAPAGPSMDQQNPTPTTPTDPNKWHPSIGNDIAELNPRSTTCLAGLDRFRIAARQDVRRAAIGLIVDQQPAGTPGRPHSDDRKLAWVSSTADVAGGANPCCFSQLARTTGTTGTPYGPRWPRGSLPWPSTGPAMPTRRPELIGFPVTSAFRSHLRTLTWASPTCPESTLSCGTQAGRHAHLRERARRTRRSVPTYAVGRAARRARRTTVAWSASSRCAMQWAVAA
jgi:hypothetical protein